MLHASFKIMKSYVLEKEVSFKAITIYECDGHFGHVT